MGDSQARGESDPRRSAPLFDPVVGMRALADIQAEGLRAAGELLERVLRSEPDRPGPRPQSSRGDYTALVDAWADLLRRIAAGLAQPVEPDAVTVPVDSNGVGPPVRLALCESESANGAVAEVWLHNGTFSAVGPLAQRCGPLSNSDGTVLEGAEVCFEPREMPLLPARSSRAVVVSLAATRALRPGTYRGTIQADGAPGLWLPLEVAIDPC
jgi:hypothetical protein